MQFERGDLVRHKDGGPLMLVKVASQDLVVCIWFDAALELRIGTFTRSLLVNMNHARRQAAQPS